MHKCFIQLAVWLMVKLAAWQNENCPIYKYDFTGGPARVGKRFMLLAVRMNKVN